MMARLVVGLLVFNLFILFLFLTADLVSGPMAWAGFCIMKG